MIYRYHSKIGGWRFVVVFHDGRKHVKVLDISTLEAYTITPEQKRALVPYECSASKLAKRIRNTVRRFKRCGVAYSKTSVMKAISRLEGAA